MPKAIVTSGPTRERIDPVRYISNDSSGKQGHAIAEALAKKGYDVALISGPVSIEAPKGVKLINVESAEKMLEAVEAELPADIAIFAAAVCDWRPQIQATNKLKKKENEDELNIKFIKNPDILKTISSHQKRPKLVVGFAAETENLIENAKAKLISKGCDYIVANDVSQSIFGSNNNKVSLISYSGIQDWDYMSKKEIADRLVSIIS